MRSSSREEIVEVFDALEAGFKRALDLRCDALTTQLSTQADPAELGGKLAPELANRLRITRADASRRIHEAADLGERSALNGEPLEPLLPATAAAPPHPRPPTQRLPRGRPRRSHPRLLAPTTGFRRHRDPAQGRGAAGPT